MNALVWASLAWGFCGTYVGPASQTPTNGASRIVVAHEGNGTVVTMTSDASGGQSNFGLLIPIPNEIGEDDITVLDDTGALDLLDQYSAPREVSYTCESLNGSFGSSFGSSSSCGGSAGCGTYAASTSESLTEAALESLLAEVKVLGWVTQGAYEMAIVSASEADALTLWLDAFGFQLQPGADEIVQEYLDQGVNFMATRVTVESDETDSEWLQPIQIRYPERTFSLPLKLGATNAKAEQEVTLWVIGDAADGEAQVLTFPRVEQEHECMPEPGSTMGETVEESFDRAQQEKPKGGVVTEFTWPTFTKCDPCPPEPADNAEEFLGDLGRQDPDAHITRLRMRYDSAALNDDLHFSYTNMSSQKQLRYIAHLDELEEEFPLCFSGFPNDPAGTCTEEEPEQSAVPWWGIFLLPLTGWALRRKQ